MGVVPELFSGPRIDRPKIVRRRDIHPRRLKESVFLDALIAGLETPEVPSTDHVFRSDLR
jgi:hypothetical protein